MCVFSEKQIISELGKIKKQEFNLNKNLADYIFEHIKIMFCQSLEFHFEMSEYVYLLRIHTNFKFCVGRRLKRPYLRKSGLIDQTVTISFQCQANREEMKRVSFTLGHSGYQGSFI